MPVQIHEVIIRATVTERKPGCGDSTPKPDSPAASSSTGGASADQIAEQIFDILKSKRER